MKTLRATVALLLITAASSALAQTNATPLNASIEQKNREALDKYTQATGKPIPQTVDYRYGMKLDIQKTLYATKGVQFCGNVKKIISFVDSNGNPNSVRYVALGDCRSSR